MKLDKRIKDNYKIFTCFDTEQAKQYVDTKGYFTNDLDEYGYLDNCYYGTLNAVDNSSSRSYLNKNIPLYFNFFLPEEFVKQKEVEKKYRPYTLMEFKNIFTIGQPIKYRRKGNVGLENEIVLDGYSHEQRGDQIFTYIFIGVEEYTLQELFEEYEWQEHYTEDFKPFGVEE